MPAWRRRGLRPARRARREEHVGEVPRPVAPRRRRVRRALAHGPRGHHVHGASARRARRARLAFASRQERHGRGVVHETAEPLLRRRWIEREVRGAGAQRPVERDDELERALEEQRDDVASAHARRGEAGRDGVDLRRELAVEQRPRKVTAGARGCAAARGRSRSGPNERDVRRLSAGRRSEFGMIAARADVASRRRPERGGAVSGVGVSCASPARSGTRT